MLKAWRDSPEPSVDEVKIVGHRWSAPSFAARDFLARNAVPYRWYSVEENGGPAGLGAAVAWRIVTTRHGGVLEVRSRPGETRFVVRLPLSEVPLPG